MLNYKQGKWPETTPIKNGRFTFKQLDPQLCQALA